MALSVPFKRRHLTSKSYKWDICPLFPLSGTTIISCGVSCTLHSSQKLYCCPKIGWHWPGKLGHHHPFRRASEGSACGPVCRISVAEVLERNFLMSSEPGHHMWHICTFVSLHMNSCLMLSTFLHDKGIIHHDGSAFGRGIVEVSDGHCGRCSKSCHAFGTEGCWGIRNHLMRTDCPGEEYE